MLENYIVEGRENIKISLEAEVASGWYAGRLGLVLDGSRYGDKLAFMSEIVFVYEDGSHEVLITDENWVVCQHPKRKMAGFFDGEIFDASQSGADGAWTEVEIIDKSEPMPVAIGKVYELPELVEDIGEAVKSHEIIEPKLISHDKDEYIFDAGRNLAGIVCIKGMEAEAGARIIIETGEVLDQGKVYRGNLRTAASRIVYTCGEGLQSYEPRFTYMGFRYFSVRTEGKVEPLSSSHFPVKELYSDMELIGEFECSNEDINKLQKNILTSQKANFIDIPTDCPQRDERCGWTGDITTFSSTAAFNMDCSRFLSRWLRDVNILQEDNELGFAPFVAPDNAMGRRPGGGAWGSNEHKGVDAVWGDVAVILPWNLYMSTGDINILRDSYKGMKAQVDYVSKLIRKNENDKSYIFKAGFQLGDWLAPNENIIKNIMKAKWTSTAYYANSANIVAKAAGVLGLEEDCRKYRRLYERICLAFRNTFLKNGHIKKGFQSIYALCICFGILSEEERANAASDLAFDVKKHDNHLSTGFVGTPYLPFALSDTGYMDVAYDLLLQETFPSWLYPVKAGATSIWERWDSLKPDGTVNGAGDMVSFNHYSYGAVGDFLYRRVAGLEALEAGYKKFAIKPCPGGNLTHARVSHRCPYGEIKAAWRIEDDRVIIDFTVPAGTTAVIRETEKITWNTDRYEYGSGTYQVASFRI